jgi:hypothetical protein
MSFRPKADWIPRNLVRELRTQGSVGEAAGNRCLYPASGTLKLGFWQDWLSYIKGSFHCGPLGVH